VRDTYHALLADSSSSPAALAIAAVINNLFTPTELVQADSGVGYAVRLTVQDEATAVTVGSVIGAVIGGAFGGAFGAGVGAGLGGIMGGAVGECLD
jgi:uncharacterized protein YcfJ